MLAWLSTPMGCSTSRSMTDHLIHVDAAARLLAAKGYTTAREPNGFTVRDESGKIVARTLVDVNATIVRHAIAHLLK